MFTTHTSLRAVFHNGRNYWRWHAELVADRALPAELTHGRTGLAATMEAGYLQMMTAQSVLEEQAVALGFKLNEPQL